MSHPQARRAFVGSILAFAWCFAIWCLAVLDALELAAELKFSATEYRSLRLSSHSDGGFTALPGLVF